MEGLENSVVELGIGGCDKSGSAQLLQLSVSSMEGVVEVLCESGILRISYYPMCITLSSIEERITSLGFRILRQESPKKKGPVGRFLDRLATSNEKNFGSKPLDCCTAGREKKPTS